MERAAGSISHRWWAQSDIHLYVLVLTCHPGPLIVCNTSAFDQDMFKDVWQPLISAISYAFMSFDDDYVIERSITGFRQCATLAGHFRMPDVFDHVVVTLSQTTTLLWEHVPSAVPNYPVVDVNGQMVTCSGLSVKFGTNVKAQLAAVVLFNIVNGNGNALREGWTQVSHARVGTWIPDG
jgi:brefeldin A-resistance guanine nucleotide exchange factor 1